MLILTHTQTVIDMMDDKKKSWDLFTNREALSLLFSVVTHAGSSKAREVISHPPLTPPPALLPPIYLLQ